MYTYLLLNGITLLFPLVLAFDRKVAFYRYWGHVLTALIPVAVFFILWDVWFTKAGIWDFNHAYLLGPEWLSLPLEEWLFFVTVPFACLFIYEVVLNYGNPGLWPVTGQRIAVVLGSVLIVLGLGFPQQLYTTVTFNLAGALLLINGLWLKPSYLTNFFITYLLHLIPFAVVNGVLTALPVVVYNNAENFGFRIGTIPVEDSIYSMLLLLMNVNLYEYLKSRWPVKKPSHPKVPNSAPKPNA